VFRSSSQLVALLNTSASSAVAWKADIKVIPAVGCSVLSPINLEGVYGQNKLDLSTPAKRSYNKGDSFAHFFEDLMISLKHCHPFSSLSPLATYLSSWLLTYTLARLETQSPAPFDTSWSVFCLEVQQTCSWEPGQT
jgi:hypothetical protein